MSYETDVAAFGLWASWRMNDTGSPLADSSGNSRTLALTGSAPTFSVTGAIVGDSDKAITFAGVSEYAVSATPNTVRTIIAWFKTTTAAASGAAMPLVQTEWSANSQSYWGLFINDAGKLVGRTTNANTYDITTAGAVNDGNWHMAVLVTNLTSTKLYLDGALVGTATVTFDTTWSNKVRVAYGQNTGLGSYRYYTGTLDDVAFLTTALTATNVSDLYASANGSGGTTITGNLATETDTALSGSAKVGVVVAGTQAAETDSALSGSTRVGVIVVGTQATETDTALSGSISYATMIPGALATETDTALAGAVHAGSVVAGGQAVETDTALAGTVDDPGPVLPDAESDTTNDAYKLTLGGWGVATWEPAIVLAPSTDVRHAVISAIAYGPVTFDPADPTQPVFTYSEADAPRLRQRILLRGRDVTYDRDVPTPDVEYELSDLLLYGPGSLDLPAVMAAWEMGTDATDGFTRGPRVKVQLVDDFTDPEQPTVVATTYKGFGLNPAVSGGHLTLELGGEAQGRLTLRDAKVLFRDVLDISRLLWRELTDVGVRYLPRLGEPGLGIKTLNFGGVGKADKVQELLSRAIKKDGTQRAVLPGEDGVYRPIDKDTTTVHFSVFVDDAFTVPDLSSDLAEKPNSIYPTAIAPNGHRIDGAAVGGLLATPAPPYPMDDDSNFGEGTTNEDTDSGDGVSIIVNRLGSVGLLDIRDTPGGFDEDVTDALAKLQNRARLTGPVGVMTPALWRVLWDLDVTGRSARWSTIQPTAQDPSVQQYKRAASGAPIGLNPDRDEDAIQVDESIDMGTGITERQVQNWSETRVHAPDEKVWYGTITVHMGAVLAGQVDIGAIITAEDLVDARLVKPGLHNLWVPNFDGGTLFGVSGAQVNADSVAFTVDTRFRPAREIWERQQVRRETRPDPARRWLGSRQSTQEKDAVRGFISWGGVIDRDIPLEAGHNMVELVVGDYGTLARFRTHVVDEEGNGVEHSVALFGAPPSGDSITVARWADLVPTPLAENGDRPYRRRATRRALRAHGLLDAWGTHDEPAGYEGDLKSDDAVLTGVEEVTDIPFVGEDGYLVRVMIWVAAPAILRHGRAAWPLLEGGV